MRQTVWGAGAAILALAGCTPAPLIDKVPEAVGGLPADAPQRPANPYLYPAVHDMPPPREAKPLNEEDQVKLEKDLEATRDRQAGELAKDDQDQDTPAPAKKKAKPAKTSQKSRADTGANTGAKPNP